MAQPVRLEWVAAHRDHATFSCGAGLDYESFIRSEAPFGAPHDYLLIPVHPVRLVKLLLNAGRLRQAPGCGGLTGPS